MRREGSPVTLYCFFHVELTDRRIADVVLDEQKFLLWLKETLKALSKTLEDLVAIGVAFVRLYPGSFGLGILFIVGMVAVSALGVTLRLERSAVVGLVRILTKR